jgi:hypothetical protein
MVAMNSSSRRSIRSTTRLKGAQAAEREHQQLSRSFIANFADAWLSTETATRLGGSRRTHLSKKLITSDGLMFSALKMSCKMLRVSVSISACLAASDGAPFSSCSLKRAFFGQACVCGACLLSKSQVEAGKSGVLTVLRRCTALVESVTALSTSPDAAMIRGYRAGLLARRPEQRIVL